MVHTHAGIHLCKLVILFPVTAQRLPWACWVWPREYTLYTTLSMHAYCHAGGDKPLQ